MQNRPIIKCAGLFVLYTALLLGIFIAQFRTASGIGADIGALHLSLSRADVVGTNASDAAAGAAQADTAANAEETPAPAAEETEQLKNEFTVTFKGLTFAATEFAPLEAVSSENTAVPLVLKSWEEHDDHSVQLSFEDGSRLIFSVSDMTQNATLTVTAFAGTPGWKTLRLPYKVSKSFSTEEQSETRIIFSNRNVKYAFKASRFDDGSIAFTPRDNSASYGKYEAKVFSFASLAGLSLTDDKAYTATMQRFRTQIVESGAQALKTNASVLTEADLVAYVAEMGSRGRIDEARNSIPESLKSSSRRTYLSTPFFGSLASMNRSLVARTKRYAASVQTAISEHDLDIFAEEGISDYILRERKTDAMRSLLTMPGELHPFAPTPKQAAAILTVYTRVRRLNEELADLLEKQLQPCVDVITKHLSYENGVLVLSAAEVKDKFDVAAEEEEALPEFTSYERLQIAEALLEYGRGKNRNEYCDAGRLLINQELANAASLDFHSLAELYPLLVQDNTFYPHTAVLGYYGKNPVWAWTCASNVTYKIDGSGVVSINMDFPLERSHYMIITGVPTFHGNIEIQNVRFRTDSRFEVYNSSGYVYEEQSLTMLLKSRHRSPNELVRLFCDPVNNFTGPDDSLASMQQQVQNLGLSNVTVKKSEEGLTLSVENIQFEAESSVLRASEYPKLEQIAKILKVAYLENDIMVSGHTAKSSVGRDPQELSVERATTVADYLAEQGVRERSHIFTQGFGDTKPVAANDTEAGRAKNRRVEITIMNK